MALTQGSFIWFDNAIKNLSNGAIDLDSHTFKMALLSSAFSPNVTTQEFYDAGVTASELPTANGYTAGGITLTSVAWTNKAAGKYGFGFENPTWNVTGGNLVTRYWLVYDSTPATNKPLLCYGAHNYNNGTPLDVTTVNGNAFSVVLGADGLFTATRINNP